jgi:hypothetical protein
MEYYVILSVRPIPRTITITKEELNMIIELCCTSVDKHRHQVTTCSAN